MTDTVNYSEDWRILFHIVIEVFNLFKSDSMNYPDDGQDVPQIVPVRMTLEADSVSMHFNL